MKPITIAFDFIHPDTKTYTVAATVYPAMPGSRTEDGRLLDDGSEMEIELSSIKKNGAKIDDIPFRMEQEILTKAAEIWREKTAGYEHI